MCLDFGFLGPAFVFFVTREHIMCLSSGVGGLALSHEMETRVLGAGSAYHSSFE